MKTAPRFHLYVLDHDQPSGLAATGLQTEKLTDPARIEQPALILLGPGQQAPEPLAGMAIELPPDASPAALRELVRVAMENVALKQQVTELEVEAHRRHRQFRELNRIGIALSAEKDIDRLQSFILTTMRQLTHADGASLWLKMEEDGVPKLFLASSQNHSIDKSTYSAFKVPVDDKTVVGYTVSMGTSQIYDDAYKPPPGKPAGGKSFDSQFGYRTKSMLTVPMRNYNNEVVGAVQLINAKKLIPGQLKVIQSRFEFIERSVKVKYAMEKLEAMRSGQNGPDLTDIDRRLEEEMAQLDRWVDSIVVANEPSVMPEDKASTIEFLAQQTYFDIAGRPHPMLEPQEFRFLSIRKGTLDPQERLEMESHVTHSFHFLTKIPWTPVMRGIPEIAYGHHEKLDGSGYPRGLTGDQIPLQARMMTISDIYDALTAQDRPYKRAVATTTALDILHEEANQGKLDRDLLEIFIAKKIYEPSATR